MKKKNILISTISLSILIFVIIYIFILSYKSRRDYLMKNYFSDVVTENCKMKSFGQEIGQRKYKDYTFDKDGNLKWACEGNNHTIYKPERLHKNINGLKCEVVVCRKDPHIERIYVIRGTDPIEGPRYDIKI